MKKLCRFFRRLDQIASDHEAMELLRFASLKRGWGWRWDGMDLQQVPLGPATCERGCEFDGKIGFMPPCDADLCPGVAIDVEGDETHADPADALRKRGP